MRMTFLLVVALAAGGCGDVLAPRPELSRPAFRGSLRDTLGAGAEWAGGTGTWSNAPRLPAMVYEQGADGSWTFLFSTRPVGCGGAGCSDVPLVWCAYDSTAAAISISRWAVLLEGEAGEPAAFRDTLAGGYPMECGVLLEEITDSLVAGRFQAHVGGACDGDRVFSFWLRRHEVAGALTAARMRQEGTHDPEG